jgi:membrane dipeptidase
MTTWFDAHLDLACLAVNGRDLERPLETCGGPWQPAGVCFDSLRAGGVHRCLGTIFTEADGPANEPSAYPAGDWAAAARAGRLQLACYQDWAARGVGPRVQILIEGADPIADPSELAWWKAQGVVAVGMAWWKPSRYAGGNGTSLGLTDLGRALAQEIDRLGLVHDLSHLSDPAAEELLSITTGRVMASHSNARALCGGGGRGENQRHLSDGLIRAIAQRDGVIGLNLFSKFIDPAAGDEGRATLEHAADHVEHIARLAGHRRCVGLGSDMDGGFSARRLPQGIDSAAQLDRLAQTLAARGWSDEDLRGFTHANWHRLFGP